MSPDRRQRGPLSPRPEVWRVLERDGLLRRALTRFYARVFEDDRLGPFFAETGVTRAHVIDKQYSFLRSILTGDRSYFGNRPRNAHHWMVVTDALFDHREALLAECLAEEGVPSEAAAAIRALDEVFRKQIVKTAPVPRRMGGIELPLDGIEEMEMPLATLCDACQGEVRAGERIRYHVRTGRALCLHCASEG